MKIPTENRRSLAAKARAKKELEENPLKYKEMGSKGGQVKSPKGFAINKEALALAIQKSVEVRKRNK